MSCLSASKVALNKQNDYEHAGFIIYIEPEVAENFFKALVDCRNQAILSKPFDKKSIEYVKTTWKAVFEKKPFPDDSKFNSYLRQKSEDLFTWSDYSEAYFKWKVTAPKLYRLEGTSQNQRVVKIEFPKNAPPPKEEPFFTACGEIVYAYYMLTRRYEEESWAKFIEHDPYDYTRPNGWYNHPGYVGMGEAITAMMNIKENKTEKLASSKKILTLFQEQYNPYFEKLQEFADFLIPYELYSQCWHDSQSPSDIKPFSIEICAYYVRQRRMEYKYIHYEKASKEMGTSLKFSRYFLPSYKYLDAFDLIRHLTLWDNWFAIYKQIPHCLEWKWDQYLKHCSSYFKFREYTGPRLKEKVNITSEAWYGVTLSNKNVTYREILVQASQFLGDILNAFSLAFILQGQIQIQYRNWKDDPPQDLVKVSANAPEEGLQKCILEKILEKHDKIMEFLEDWAERKWTTIHKRNEEEDEETGIRKPIWSCDYLTIVPLMREIPKSQELVKMQKIVNRLEIKKKEFEILDFGLDDLTKKLKSSAFNSVTVKDTTTEPLHHGLHAMNSLFPKLRPHHYITLGLHASYPSKFPDPSQGNLTSFADSELQNQFKEIIETLAERYLGIDSEKTRLDKALKKQKKLEKEAKKKRKEQEREKSRSPSPEKKMKKGGFLGIFRGSTPKKEGRRRGRGEKSSNGGRKRNRRT